MTCTGKIGEVRGEPRVGLRDTFASNSYATRSAFERVDTVKHRTLDSPHTLNFGKHASLPRWGEPDYQMISSATTFARGGIQPGQGLKGTYVRDPHTGVWHKGQGINNPLFLPRRSASQPLRLADQCRPVVRKR